MIILPALLYASRPGFVFSHQLPAGNPIKDLSSPVTPA
jgi:hypothetical protein